MKYLHASRQARWNFRQFHNFDYLQAALLEQRGYELLILDRHTEKTLFSISKQAKKSHPYIDLSKTINSLHDQAIHPPIRSSSFILAKDIILEVQPDSHLTGSILVRKFFNSFEVLGSSPRVENQSSFEHCVDVL